MARLPSVTDLGGSPAIAAERPVATYDATPIAKGAEAIASSMAQFGKVVENDAEAVADLQEKRQTLAGTLSKANMLAGLEGKAEEYRHRTDYQTFPGQWAADAQAIVDDNTGGMPDGPIKQRLLGEMKVHLANEGAKIGEQAWRAHTDEYKAGVLADKNDMTANMKSDPDDPTHVERLKTHGAMIDEGVKNGFLTKLEGETLRQEAGIAVAHADASIKEANDPMGYLRARGVLPRGAEALPSYWNKEAARRATGVNQDLMGVVQRASEIAGVQFTIGDMGGTRDQATQDKLVAAGRSQTHNSNHLGGNAIDLIPIVDGKANPDATPQQFQAISAAMKQASKEAGIDINWGGDWKSFKDEAHFELAGKPRPAGEMSNPLWKLLPTETLLRLDNSARTRVQQQSNDAIKIAGQAQLAAAQGFERRIIDGEAGVAAMPDRKEIADNPTLDEGHRNNLLRQIDTAGRKNDSYNGTLIKFMTPDGGTFNPYDAGEKKNVDQIYTNLGGDMPALQRVVDRTGIVPPTAGVQLRGALMSSNVQNVVAAAQMSRNLMAKNPTIFAGVEGESELQHAGVAYAHYTENFGMTPEQAAQKIIETQSPEYKAKVHAIVKDEDVNKIIKDNLSDKDLEGGFNESWKRHIIARWGSPTIEFDPETRRAAFTDYAELFKDRYLKTGDENLAKTQAIAQMKILWGVSHFQGSGAGNVMRFAPEHAPAYANIPDVATKIADAAIADIKAGTGEDIARDKIVLTPTLGGQTAQAYWAGQPVPYLLSWTDKNGHPQTLNPGKAFVFDGKAAADKITEEHRVGLEAGQAAADATTARIAGDQAAMAHGSDTMAKLGTPEYFQEAARRESGRDVEYQIRALDRQEHALEKSGLGGAFLQAQRLRIATRRAELDQQKGIGSAPPLDHDAHAAWRDSP